MPTSTQVVTTEEVVRLLASTDAELLGHQESPAAYASLAFAMIEAYVLVSSPQALSWISFLRIWRVYKDYKKRAQKAAGSALAKALTARGGRDICDRLDYCQRKANLKELFDFADSPEGKKLFAEGAAAAMESKWKILG